MFSCHYPFINHLKKGSGALPLGLEMHSCLGFGGEFLRLKEMKEFHEHDNVRNR